MKNSYQWASIFSLTLAVACSASNEPGGVGGTGAVAGDTGTAGFAGDTGVAGYAGDTGVAGDTGTAGVGVGGTAGVGVGGTAGTAGTAGTGGTTGTIPDGNLHGATASSVSSSYYLTQYNAWKSTYFESCSGTEGRVKRPTDGNDTVSEGIAYGMLAAVAAGDQTTFDKLWTYYKNRRNGNGVMNWRYSGCEGGAVGQNGATDAELDAAMGLLQAKKRWGTASYGTDADALMSAIAKHEVYTNCNGQYHVLRPGDAWGGCVTEAKATNPSYFAPAYYKVFAIAQPANAAMWNKLADDTYAHLATNQDSSGYVTDWARANGVRGGGDLDKYGWEACRSPWRIATDYAWSEDPRAAAYMNKLNTKLPSQHPEKTSYDNNSCFHGGYALAALNKDSGTFQTYVSNWLTTSSNDGSYYQDTLRIVYLALAGGLFDSSL